MNLTNLTRTPSASRCRMASFVFIIVMILLMSGPGASLWMTPKPAVEAVDFQSRVVYRSEREPHYAAWTSFFPGEDGKWYIGCEEVSLPGTPLPQSSPEAIFGMGLPNGYDKSQYLMEAVLLESTDDLQTWKVISREPYRHHHTVAQFATAKTSNGRFLRFNWACYDLDPRTKTNEILRVSSDNGRTWEPAAPFLPDRFAYYPHRLRTLRDGTLVLCLPMAPRWGAAGITHPDGDQPQREQRYEDVAVFQLRRGGSWAGPLPILDGQNVSETDFVELPDGHLLFFNSSDWPNRGGSSFTATANDLFPARWRTCGAARFPKRPA